MAKPNEQDLAARLYDTPIMAASERGSKITAVRGAFLEASLHVVDLVPEGRELALALTKLEEACMWAVKGIARGPHA